MPDINDSTQGSTVDRFEVIDKKDFNALKIRYLELTSLFEINKILNSTLELKTILDNVILTPMGRLMVSKGLVLLVEQNDILKVQNIKGAPSRLLGHCYSLQSFPEHSLLLNSSEIYSDRFLHEMQLNNMEILVPMTAGGKYLGLLAYGKKFSNEPFSQEDIDFLESLANLAAIAVDKSLLFKEIKTTNKKLDKKIQELNTLFEISRELNSSLDQSQIAQMLSFAIMGELLINKCIVVIETDGQLKLEVAKGIGSKNANFDFSECKIPILEIFQSGRNYIFLEDEINNPDFENACKKLFDSGIYYLIPMISKDKTKGFIGVGKKITGEEVLQEDLSFLQTLGNDAMISIDNARMVVQMLEKQRMEDELKIAREIQANLLPRKLPDIPEFEIVGKNISSYQVGGDYYDCIQLNEHLYGIAIADVSGKSTPAALLMANLQASLRALAHEKHDVVETVEKINKIICQNTTIDKFITFFYFILNIKEKTITYTNAGHNPPYLIRKGEPLQLLNKGGLILGLISDAKYEVETIQLQKEDTVILFTDGITEAMNEMEEEFDESRLESLLVNSTIQSAENLMEMVQNEVAKFVNGVAQSDDMTMVVLRAC